MADLVKTFSGEGDFDAMTKMEDFLRVAGFAIGSSQRDDPRGIMFGLEYDIQKWRNLSKRDRDMLDGVATGNQRSGPITVRIYAHANQEAKRAFHQTALAMLASV